MAGETPKVDYSKSRVANLVIPLVSAVVALAGVSVGLYNSNKALNVLSDRNRDEFTYSARRSGFNGMLRGMLEACQDARLGRMDDLQDHLIEIEEGYTTLRPFLGKEDRDSLASSIRRLYEEIDSLMPGDPNAKPWAYFEDGCSEIRREVMDRLADAVFGNRERPGHKRL